MMGRAMAVLALWLALLALASAPPAQARSRFPDEHDALIREAAERYMPGIPWQAYKAQLYQESQLNPDAVSPVGARGIAQFMPGTWADIAPAIGARGFSPHAVGPAIRGGALYMARLRGEWTAPRPAKDRHSLALASYNAGLGNILAAQRKAGGANRYDAIIAELHRVTGRHASETRTYVARTWRWFWAMLTGG